MRIAILAVILLVCSPELRASAEDREGVIFILGRDENASSPMFRQAENYCRTSTEGGGDPVVPDLRSLSEVRDYLAEHAPKNGKPWGLIQFVVHGNGGGQLALPLVPGGEFFMVRSLASAVSRGTFRALPDALLDSRSEVRIHGCALGRNGELLRALSRALGGADPERPLVRASRYFTCYQAPEHKETTPTRFLSEAWRFAYPAGHTPSLETINTRIQEEHPGLKLDVADALTRTSPRFPGDTFSCRAPATFHWTLVFRRPEDCPVLTDPVRLRCWLGEQIVFPQRLEEADLTMDQMDWSARRVTRSLDGRERPAIRVDGTGEVLYILRALTMEPSWDDPLVFAMER